MPSVNGHSALAEPVADGGEAFSTPPNLFAAKPQSVWYRRTTALRRWGIAAVDPTIIPLGSRLAIDGFNQLFVAEDTGFGVRGLHVDVFLPDKEAAIQFGVQYRDVIVLN